MSVSRAVPEPEPFDVDVTLHVEYRTDGIPTMLAHTVAGVHQGRYAGSEILVTLGGVTVMVHMDGDQYAWMGFSYSTLATALLNAFSEHVKPDLAPAVAP